MPELKAEQSFRDRWTGSVGFVLAAMGSAVGLGNLWRFPVLAARHGGGLFLIPYLIALFAVGIPLLLLELGIGQRYQFNGYDTMAHVNKYFKGVGLAGALVGALLNSYYLAVLSWSLVYLGYSFTTNDAGQLPWSADPAGFFFGEVLQISSGPDEMGELVPAVIGCAVLGWVIVGLCIFKGASLMSKVVLVTMPLPMICLFCLIIRAVTLPGAGDGLYYYVAGGPNSTPLSDFSVWVDAFGQIFFSLSLGMSIMTTYGSYNDMSKTTLVRDGLIIALGNSAVSLCAGVAVFGTFGYLAHVQGVPVEAVVAGGPGLAFVVYPYAIAQFPGGVGLQAFFSVVFFIMLFTLGLDSAFSLIETITAIAVDNLPRLTHMAWAQNLKREYVAAAMCAISMFTTFGYCTQGGLYYLDIVDYHLNLILALMGATTLFAVGWAFRGEGYKVPSLTEQFKPQSLVEVAKDLLRTENEWVALTWAFFVKYVSFPLVLIVQIFGWVGAAEAGQYGGYPPLWNGVLGWLFYGFFLLVMIVFGLLPYNAPPVEGGDYVKSSVA
mmetsp:Transcript_14703/g.38225  ORF Transcript_14703/g.38225 Transcript_14703/m.38225 type:complete len:549 (-) Transcript_14703:264-1910(-)|eukprot:CAMPEP_0119412996 /NCGR_PEP_ID=MMETSP1335-20130426/5224_1 /TAXON_ID=259385 /ORGANISM="Chrysoculter rhomboideus, Strain RCC1486" /LENGTH=548 /DNA_ID=CAMNT_0007437765 /DNA_START=80 /DNA_END=1726 /DNA_ORIENTATION=-